MNNEASQKLQTAGGAEREARAVEAIKRGIARWRTHDDEFIECEGFLTAVLKDEVMKLLAACANEARLEALEQAAHICDFAADGTTEKMSEGGYSETWKIIAEQSVEQYHSIARHIRALKAAPESSCK